MDARFLKAAAFFIFGAALTSQLWGGLLALLVWHLLDREEKIFSDKK